MDNNELFIKGDKLYEEKKLSESFAVFMSAAENGDVSSMTRIASMYTCGEGVDCDYDKAIKWDLKAIELGEISSMVNIGISYRIKGEIKQSKYWFEKAIEAGDGSGAIQLAKLYMVSDKETKRVKEYLNYAIASENMCEADIEEAKQYLSEIENT
ncbi:MAG: sel1 repeat family protein [Methylococcaceae bacterium]|nr:sel1 repeat family protein [Methylococcaceae bacterium]